jgi:flagellar export protein FliJ
MKSLHTLLKVAKRDLETLRRALGEQISRAALIKERAAAHERAIVREQQVAGRDYESQRAYGGYIQLALHGRRALAAEGEMIAAEVERLRSMISEAHVEMRKFERLIELEEARAKVAREKRENAELDEFATMRAARTSPR